MINKNAIKEIISAIKHPKTDRITNIEQPTAKTPSSKKETGQRACPTEELLRRDLEYRRHARWHAAAIPRC